MKQYPNQAATDTKILVSWSSGKDSAFMLQKLLQDSKVTVCGLLTTFNQKYDRVAMHGVRRELVEAQAENIGLPLWQVDLPDNCSNSEYEAIMAKEIIKAKEEGITHFAFADLFLEDIKNYRIRKLQDTGIKALFPLWLYDTKLLSREISEQFGVVITVVDSQQISADFVGRHYNESLLNDLPESADPCGENGEFHSFVYHAPYFKNRINIKKGELKTRGQFNFCDFTLYL